MSEATRVIVLLATILPRKRSCERVLAEIATQSRVPDGILLVLDGYGDAPAPPSRLPIWKEYRTEKCVGAGNRWLATSCLAPEDIVICLDDDVMLCQAPKLIEALVEAVEIFGDAAAAMGRTQQGHFAPPGVYSQGDLFYGAGCGLTMRAKHLSGLREFANEIKHSGGPDALGLHGDDDALVSAYLWKNKVRIRHAKTGNIFEAPNMRSTSHTAAVAAQGFNAQKLVIAKLTGWPWTERRI